MVMEQNVDTQKSAPASNNNNTTAKIGASTLPSTPSSSSSSPPFDPHSLGREFVRQYYTVLNKGPHILHRFYAEDSSLIHGSLNKPGDNTVDTVYGEVEINNRILSLNFKDCHAKIRQVDSLETLDRGVVVQVSGELSNNGQPMRRFFQTFVLAPRSPTNYYVRNDIFRYQDEVLSEEEHDQVEEGIESEVGDKGGGIQLEEEPEESQTVDPVSAQSVQSSSETFPTIQSSASKEGVLNKGELPNGHTDTSSSSVAPDSTTENEWEQPQPVVQSEGLNKGKEPNTSSSIIPPQPSGPISWAAIIKKQEPDVSGSSFIPSSYSLKPIVSTETGLHNIVPSNLSPIPPSSSLNMNVPSQSSSGKSPKGNDSRSNRRIRKQENRESTSQIGEVNPGSGSVDSGDHSSPPSIVNNKKTVGPGGGPGMVATGSSGGLYADEQQVFVGNLPQDITEETLKQFFSKYGTILDVRINRTNQQKNSNTRTPNYGFVTFDKTDIVQSILRQKPIYFNEHRFNVEEKRSQGRAVGKSGQDGGRRNDRNPDGGPRLGGGGNGGNHRGDHPGGQRKDRGNRDKPGFGDRKDDQRRSGPGNGNVNTGGRMSGGGGNGPPPRR